MTEPSGPLPLRDDRQRTADRLLMLLKTRGALSTRALAEALEISVPAVRQHLRSLGGLVESRTEKQGVGRPARQWRLTEEAQARFPDTHAEMTVRLIGLIEERLGPAALDQVVEASYQQDLARYRQALAGSASVDQRVRRLARLRSDEGYMAEVRRDGADWLLLEHHCPICAAARTCQGFCRNELALFRSVLGEDVTVARSEYLLEGGERCAYRITPQDPPL